MRSVFRGLALAGSVAFVLTACSAPAGPQIVMTESSWEAIPASVAAGGGEFELTVVNETDVDQPFVVVTICDVKELDYTPEQQDPAALPMTNGLLDLSRDGLCGDPENLNTALFWVVSGDWEPREGEDLQQAPMTPDVALADSESTITIGGFKGGGEPGTYVILSWTPGAYEAGAYAAFTITD